MWKGGQIDGSADEPPTSPSRGPEGCQSASHTEPDQTPKEGLGEFVQARSPCIEPARRYLDLLADGDAAHSFQTYYDPDPRCPDTAWMHRGVHGHLDAVWQSLVARQGKGAAIAVNMAETDGRGRKNANMVRPRAVWIEADSEPPRELPLLPTMTVETSPGRRHFVYVVRDLSWELWHGVQQTLIEEYGSDARAGLRTQVLRLPGTLHQKDPAKPHLVHFVEELTSERIYTAAEIAAAFPPRPTSPSRRRARVRTASASPRRDRTGGGAGGEWQPDKILSALMAIDARFQASGAFKVQGDRPDDQEFVVDWARRDWWLRAMACIHHASGGSDAGFELSCAASGGDSSKGLVGCPTKFNAADQRRVWDSLTSGEVPELRGAAATIRTIYWIAHRYCGWEAGRRGRPLGQPRPSMGTSTEAQAVAEAGQWAVRMGLDRIRTAHTALGGQRVTKNSLMNRVLTEIRKRLDAKTGVAAIGSLAGMAGTLGCRPETLRRYLRRLAAGHLIIKNDGNATSMLGTSGITIALAFPEGIRGVIENQLSGATVDPPISSPTGIPTPQFRDEAGRNPSRSPTSHDAAGATGSKGEPDDLWRKADLSLGDWFEAGVLHAEVGDHLERLADAHGKRGVSRVLARLKELRSQRPSFSEICADVERAADIAARGVVRINARGLTEPNLRQPLDGACAATISDDDSALFVRELAKHLGSIVREAKGDPDPWRSKRWQRPKQSPDVARSEVNAYAAARFKRDAPH